MPIIRSKHTFPESLPTIADICAAATGICGLRVVAEECGATWLASLSFAAHPDCVAGLYARAGANPPHVEVEIVMGGEMTLYWAIVQALRSLGGVPEGPNPEAVPAMYARPITERHLRRRQAWARAKGILGWIVCALLCPIVRLVGGFGGRTGSGA